jgi:hypothetical protein
MMNASKNDRIRFIRTYLIFKLTGRPPRITRMFSSWAMEVIILTEDKLRMKYLIMMAVSMNRSLLGRCTKSDVQTIIEHFTLRLSSGYGINGVDWDVLILGITLDGD